MFDVNGSVSIAQAQCPSSLAHQLGISTVSDSVPSLVSTQFHSCLASRHCFNVSLPFGTSFRSVSTLHDSNHSSLSRLRLRFALFRLGLHCTHLQSIRRPAGAADEPGGSGGGGRKSSIEAGNQCWLPPTGENPAGVLSRSRRAEQPRLHGRGRGTTEGWAGRGRTEGVAHTRQARHPKHGGDRAVHPDRWSVTMIDRPGSPEAAATIRSHSGLPEATGDDRGRPRGEGYRHQRSPTGGAAMPGQKTEAARDNRPRGHRE